MDAAPAVAQEVGQELAAAVHAVVAVEHHDVLVERRQADPQAPGGLLFAVAL